MKSATTRAKANTALLFVISALLVQGCQPVATIPEDRPVDGYPVTVTNCGASLEIAAPPERLVLLKSAPVTALHELGVLDRAIARAGVFPAEYFDDSTLIELDAIPSLTQDIDVTGHLQISKETVIAQQPDLVLGEVENLDRDSLQQLGIPLIEEPEFCSVGQDTDPDFDSIYEQLRLYGSIFDRSDRAEEVVASLQARFDAVREKVGTEIRGTAVMLYPTVGGGSLYAYGSSSMADAQLEAAGYENGFADVHERVFEISAEQLLQRDPDVIILLHSAGAPADVEESLRMLPGAEDLAAVRNNSTMTLLLNFSTPATPLAVSGLEQIVARFTP